MKSIFIGIALLLAAAAPCLAQAEPALSAPPTAPSTAPKITGRQPPTPSPQAAAAQEKQQQPQSPEQTAVALVQQQRNQAQSQASDLQAAITFLQAQMAQEKQYWADYVKGIYEAKSGELKEER